LFFFVGMTGVAQAISLAEVVKKEVMTNGKGKGGWLNLFLLLRWLVLTTFCTP